MDLLLIIGLPLIALAIVLAFAPRVGLQARMRARRATVHRIRVEDALKHLSDCEYRDVPVTIESIAGSLGITSNDAASVADTLVAGGFVRASDRLYALSDAGRRYALRIVRRHRVLERFFADETLMRNEEWHGRAERDEHFLSDADVETMAAQLGRPRFDPHGDPIPTATGLLPAARGRPLEQLAEGATAEILHVEDEPSAVYAALAAGGLSAGSPITLVGREPSGVRVRVHEEERVLSPLEASAISIGEDDLPAPKDIPVPLDEIPLSSLPVGATASVVRIDSACRGQQRRRLMDLGILPGINITAELRSPGGEPVAYRVRDALIALRRRHAEMIIVRKETA